MIWFAIASAIALALGASGGATSVLASWLAEWRKYLRKHVRDDQRRAAAKAIIDAQAEQLDAHFATLDQQLTELYEVHRDYDATVDDYQPFVDAFMTLQREAQHSSISAIGRVRAALAPEEWDAIQADVAEDLDRYWAKHERAVEKRARRSK